MQYARGGYIAMKIHPRVVLYLFLSLILLIPFSVNAADIRSTILANPCSGCHGTDGNSPGSIPTIADLDSEEIAEALLDFKSDNRSSTIMNRIAKGYTDEEIQLIADFYK